MRRLNSSTFLEGAAILDLPRTGTDGSAQDRRNCPAVVAIWSDFGHDCRAVVTIMAPFCARRGPAMQGRTGPREATRGRSAATSKELLLCDG